MSIAHDIASKISETFEDVEITEVNAKNKTIEMEKDEICWSIKYSNKNRCEIYYNTHFLSRCNVKDYDELMTLLSKYIEKVEEDEYLRKIGEALCQYIIEDGLPEGSEIINQSSNKSGGFLKLKLPGDNYLVKIKTKYDPPGVTVEHFTTAKQFDLNDPDCNKQVMQYINKIEE